MELYAIVVKSLSTIEIIFLVSTKFFHSMNRKFEMELRTSSEEESMDVWSRCLDTKVKFIK